MDFGALIVEYQTLKSDKTLEELSNLQARADALDTLSFIKEVIDYNPEAQDLIALAGEVEQLYNHLDKLNTQLFSDIRERIMSPHSTKASLRKLFDSYTSYQARENDYVHTDYEALDVLIAGTLLSSKVPEPSLAVGPEMIHWEASPGSVILDLLDHVEFKDEDVFIDLGSGLGNIAAVVSILSDVEIIGIERDPAFYQYASNLARDFSLDHVTFINSDARNADLSRGTVFYLFTPFMASILHTVMNKIRRVANLHPIKVFSFGPCTPEIAALPWLHKVTSDDQHVFKLAGFVADERNI